MANPNSGNSGSDRVKTDRGGWPLSDNGQRPVSTRPPPKPPHNPHK